MRIRSTFLLLGAGGAALLLASCATVKQDITDVSTFVAKVEAGVPVAAADVQAALPAVCRFLDTTNDFVKATDDAWQLATSLAKTSPQKLADEQQAVARWVALYNASQPFCASGYKVTNVGQDLQTLMSAYKAATTPIALPPPGSAPEVISPVPSPSAPAAVTH